MPMVIPVVAAFAAGAGGVAALAVAEGVIATAAAYATIAGAVLTGVGAITGSKDLMKIGAVLSIGGGIGSIAAGAGSAASEASALNAAEGANEAAVTADAASAAGREAASNGLGQVVDATGGADTAVTAAANGGGTLPTATSSPVATGQVAVSPLTGDNGTLASTYKAVETTPGATLSTPGTVAADTGAGTSLATDAGGLTPTVTPTGTLQTTTSLGKVAEQAKSLNSNDLMSFWEKAQKGAGAIGDFVQKNPALVKIGGDMLSSMYGPAAERLDYEKGLMERARNNLNAPIRLAYAPKTGG